MKTIVNDKFSSRLVLFTVIFSVVLALTLTVINYFSQVNIYEQKELAKLQAISTTLSLNINGDELEGLIKRNPKKDAITRNDADSSYLLIHELIVKAAETNSLNTNMYTMMYDEHTDQFCFGVTSAEKPYWKHVYADYPQVLEDRYEFGGTVPPYSDENGVWLSAFYPIKNSKGQTISIIQADEQFTSFIMQARSAVFRNLLISFVVIGLIALVMIATVRSIAIKQEKLDQQMRNLEQMRKELIANVSHDLRTPLAYIQGYLETLLMKKDSLDEERFTKYLQTSLTGTERLKNLVDELFELSRIESGSRKLDLEPIRLGELVSDVVNPFRLEASEKNIELLIDISNDLAPVRADIALLDRVFQNLISNGLKYCESGDSITVSAQRDKATNGIYISVQDTGPGIAKENLPAIFDRFQRGDQLHKQGTGLGLAIVKSILDLHECSYGIESEEKKGTKFYFVLGAYDI